MYLRIALKFLVILGVVLGKSSGQAMTRGKVPRPCVASVTDLGTGQDLAIKGEMRSRDGDLTIVARSGDSIVTYDGREDSISRRNAISASFPITELWKKQLKTSISRMGKFPAFMVDAGKLFFQNDNFVSSIEIVGARLQPFHIPGDFKTELSCTACGFAISETFMIIVVQDGIAFRAKTKVDDPEWFYIAIPNFKAREYPYLKLSAWNENAVLTTGPHFPELEPAGAVYGFNLRHQEMIWSVKEPNVSIVKHSGARSLNPHIYLMADAGQSKQVVFQKVNALTGENLWGIPFSTGQSPLLSPDPLDTSHLVIIPDANSLTALDNQTGELIWQTKSEAGNVNGPILNHEGHLFVTFGLKILELEISTGKIVREMQIRLNKEEQKTDGFTYLAKLSDGSILINGNDGVTDSISKSEARDFILRFDPQIKKSE